MLDWLGSGALPLGLLMFLGMALAFIKRQRDHSSAQDAYPALAQRLGLAYRPSSHPGGIGRLSGRMAGYAVLVDPDEQRKLIVRFRGEPSIDFRTYEIPGRPPQLRSYSSGSARFDAFFKTRYASPELIQRLSKLDLDDLLTPFGGRYCRQIKQVNVTSDGVTCVLDFGHPAHIPAAAVEALLPALLRWAKVVEP